jgi:hypothetical protein
MSSCSVRVVAVVLICLAHLHAAAGSAQETSRAGRGLVATGIESAGQFPEELPNSGSMEYTVPIEIPPARSEKTKPRLQLHYSSRSVSGWVGVGWKLPAIYVERDDFSRALRGPDEIDPVTGLFREPHFRFVSDEGSLDLVQVDDRTFRPRVSDHYWRFTRDSGSWEAMDASGTRYRFGVVQDGVGAPFRWYLTEITDTIGNRTHFGYRNTASNSQIVGSNQGELALLSVEWNNLDLSPTSTRFKHRVRLIYEPRTDPVHVAAFGLLSTIGERLTAIQVQAQGDSGTWRTWRTYHLSYEQSPTNQRSLLRAVTVSGFDCEGAATAPGHVDYCKTEAVLPPTSFTYSKGPSQFDPVVTTIAGLPDNLRARKDSDLLPGILFAESGLVDLDGDGRQDYVQASPAGPFYLAAYTWSWRSNLSKLPGNTTAMTFSPELEWWGARNDASSPRFRPTSHFSNLLDMNGDGRPDLVQPAPDLVRFGSSSDAPLDWRVFLNSGGSFSTEPIIWATQETRRDLEQRITQGGHCLPSSLRQECWSPSDSHSPDWWSGSLPITGLISAATGKPPCHFVT